MVKPFPAFATGPRSVNTYIRNVGRAENPPQHQHAPGDYYVVRHLFHDAGRLTGDQCQQHGRAVEVPEQEQLAAASGGGADVAEQVAVGVPEDAVEAQHHLVQVAEAQPLDGRYLPVRQRRRELHRVRQRLRLRVRGLLEDAQRQRA